MAGVRLVTSSRRTLLDSSGAVLAVIERSLTRRNELARSGGASLYQGLASIAQSLGRSCAGLLSPTLAFADDEHPCESSRIAWEQAEVALDIAVDAMIGYLRAHGPVDPCAGDISNLVTPACQQFNTLRMILALAVAGADQRWGEYQVCLGNWPAYQQPPPVYYCGGNGPPGSGGGNQTTPPAGVPSAAPGDLPMFVDTCAASGGGGGGGGPGMTCSTSFECWEAYDADTYQLLWTWCGPTTVCIMNEN